MKDLKKRIIDLSYRLNLSHISSCLTAVDIIDEIYAKRKQGEPFILSQGHTGLALYVVLEKYLGINAEYLFHKHGVHPNRDIENGIYCSTGSLGCGISLSAGMALADRSRSVYVLISDGECQEGVIFEVLRIKDDLRLHNLKIYLNCNGFSAMEKLNKRKLKNRLWAFDKSIEIRETKTDYDFLNCVNGHYLKLSEDQYEKM